MWAIIAAGLAVAQEHKNVDVDLNKAPDGFGIGVVLGDPSGLSIALRNGEKNGVQAHFGWSFVRDTFHVNVDWFQNLVVLETPEASGVVFPVYIGVGGRLLAGRGYYFNGTYYDDPGLGVRIPVGMSVLPRSTAIDVFAEVVPVVVIIPETGATLDGGIGARVYF